MYSGASKVSKVMATSLAKRWARAQGRCVQLLCILFALSPTSVAYAVDLPMFPSQNDDGDDAPILTLKMPATESWQNWCDDSQDELAEYDIYHFCRSYAPRLVLEDKFSEKVLQNMKSGTLNVLHRTRLIHLMKWTGVEEKLRSKNTDILQGLSVEIEPGLEDTYLHLKYRFD